MPNKIKFVRDERAILALLALGTPPKLIADELELSVSSVYSYRNRLAKKAGVKRSQLPLFALENPPALIRGGECYPGMHPDDCPCGGPVCAGRRRIAA